MALTHRDGNCTRRRLASLAAALALAVTGCVPPNGYGSSTSPGGIRSDPYHYRCTGNCQAG